MTRNIRSFVAIAGIAAATLSLAACGGDDDATSTSTASKTSSTASKTASKTASPSSSTTSPSASTSENSTTSPSADAGAKGTLDPSKLDAAAMEKAFKAAGISKPDVAAKAVTEACAKDACKDAKAMTAALTKSLVKQGFTAADVTKMVGQFKFA